MWTGGGLWGRAVASPPGSVRCQASGWGPGLWGEGSGHAEPFRPLLPLTGAQPWGEAMLEPALTQKAPFWEGLHARPRAPTQAPSESGFWCEESVASGGLSAFH